jgi:hypothetical protein
MLSPAALPAPSAAALLSYVATTPCSIHNGLCTGTFSTYDPCQAWPQYNYPPCGIQLKVPNRQQLQVSPAGGFDVWLDMRTTGESPRCMIARRSSRRLLQTPLQTTTSMPMLTMPPIILQQHYQAPDVSPGPKPIYLESPLPSPYIDTVESPRPFPDKLDQSPLFYSPKPYPSTEPQPSPSPCAWTQTSPNPSPWWWIISISPQPWFYDSPKPELLDSPGPDTKPLPSPWPWFSSSSSCYPIKP